MKKGNRSLEFFALGAKGDFKGLRGTRERAKNPMILGEQCHLVTCGIQFQVGGWILKRVA